jgi:hypothetical protein
VQVDCVARYAVRRVVRAEDEVARLPVVFVHFRGVPFALLGELVGGGAVAGGVGVVGAVEA